MLSVATVGGHRVPLPVERDLLLSVQRHVLRSSIDVDALTSARPRELREALRAPERRARLVRFALLVPYVSLEAELSKVAVVDAFAVQLGVAPQTLRRLHRAREAELRRVILDHARRGARIFLTTHTSAQVRSLVDALRRRLPDDALAARYRELRALPIGTLGRALYEFHRARGFPLPGEPGAFDETLVRFDVLRVLAGYDVGDAGDLALAAFIAGASGTPSGYELMLEVLADVHARAQLRAVPATAVRAARMDLGAMPAAYERGAALASALGTAWDPWPLLGEDLVALRARCGLLPAARRQPREDVAAKARVSHAA
jgi:hypothetical protein